jgi:hypothetical protein
MCEPPTRREASNQDTSSLSGFGERIDDADLSEELSVIQVFAE